MTDIAQVPGTESPEECFLSHIFRIFRVPNHCVRNAHYKMPIRVYERVKIESVGIPRGFNRHLDQDCLLHCDALEKGHSPV
jgi:hypothetical protein